MAADLNPEWLSCLPSSWSYGVTRDGRVFFINEEAKSTTWLHPVTGEAVITGHRKTPDLPTGWEEGYTFEGARCFINHNERKVTCKHPVTGVPSQDNCIFVVNEHLNCGKLVHPVLSRPATKAPAAEKKERPTSTMSEASNYTGGSDYATHPSSPTTRLSRSSKKVHNFGKRSNSIKRNPNAPVVKNGWLYKQDSTGMKMWKKRWFVMSDMCLFYYRGESNISYSYPAERRPVPPAQSITAQSLQGKTPEELTLLLIKLRRQQAELNSLREHTLAQLMQLNLDAANPKSEILSHHLQRNLMYLDSQMKENEPVIFMIHTMIENSAPRPQLYQQQISPEEYRENTYLYRPEELDIDTKLSRLCEQDKVVRTQEEKLQQLHREKHTLETALLSASQEIEMSSENPAAVQSVIQQRDVLQSGLLSTCREVSRVNTELERSWREYDRLEADVTMAKTSLLEQLEALGSPQTEPPSQKHVQIQKELWRIQDVMEALSKNKPKRNTEPSFPGANPLSNLHKSEESDSVPPRPPLPYSYEGGDRPPHAPRTTPHRPEDRKAAQRNGAHSGPDYRLYKSEPELTTVAEVDESNGEDKSEQTGEKETAGVTKGVVYPVGVVSPRTKSPMPESSTIASYVTLRKSKKPDPRTSQPQDRPRSAVEQMSSAIEVGRTRMSVEEQMERIRRHQQGALRERRREDGSLSRSLSFTKENTYYTLQARKKSPMISPDERDGRRDTSPEERRELTTKPTDAEENCKNTEDVESGNANLENKEKAPMSRTASIKEALLRSAGPKPVLKEDESEKKRVSPLEYRRNLATQNSLQTAVMVRVGTEEDEEEDEEDEKPSSQEQDVSYELTNSKHGPLMSVNSLSTPPQSPSSSSSPPPPPSPPQLTDGSHFMCCCEHVEAFIISVDVTLAPPRASPISLQQFHDPSGR
ncbi:pleckstrin homology domain-containing family A member 5 [Garra rufa]|uniref:pleckstrin homology domain-containing family A member 5 n=1 Tax=Garra rufa TaxID=137080 RepID=UPI003CCEE3E0